MSEKTTVTQQTPPERTRVKDADNGSSVLDHVDAAAANDVDGWLQAFIDVSAEVLAEVSDDRDREKAENRELFAHFDSRLSRLEGQFEILARLFGDAAQGRAKRKILTE